MMARGKTHVAVRESALAGSATSMGSLQRTLHPAQVDRQSVCRAQSDVGRGGCCSTLHGQGQDFGPVGGWLEPLKGPMVDVIQLADCDIGDGTI